MKKKDGALISREYLERLDAAVFGTTKAPRREKKGRADLFGFFRPVVIKGAWESEGGGKKAPARFIEKGEEGDEVDVYANSSIGDALADATGAQMFAIWRGRWEVISEPAEEVEICYAVEETRAPTTVYQLQTTTLGVETVATQTSAETIRNGNVVTVYSNAIPYASGYVRFYLNYEETSGTAVSYEPKFKTIRLYK